MPHRAIPRHSGGLLALVTADALWVDLTARSAVPTASGAFSCSPAEPGAGYVLLGARAVATVRGPGGRWNVAETDVRRAATELNAVEVNREDLVRVGPFRGSQNSERNDPPTLRWRQRIARERTHAQDPGTHERAPRHDSGQVHHLCGIDWRRTFVEHIRDRTARTWWLPRAVVRVLDAAEHAETQWLRAARTCRECAAVTDRPSRQWRVHTADGPRTICPGCRTTVLCPYNGELEGHLYATLSRKHGFSRKVAAWGCAVCRTVPAAVLDHCHEHGYVRAPVCQSCNTQERPDHLYSNDVRVGDRYTRLFHTHADTWFRHWHRCPGCRARTTLPLPHLAAWTALTAGQSLRPTHRTPGSSRGRKPCGALRASWTGSQNAPGSCLITVAVDFCPSGEHRVLAQVPYREAAERFRTWLAVTAPAVAAAAGPGRLDGIPAQQFRPVIADTSSEGLMMF
ncbi:endonuclease domain-containing protein [Kitasatospora aureofaciens]|uniref:endonuclease domain-containing protein n=1 Tax=Kitasatospora aureofaciens TaxID=1894 RepID=UPI0034116A51